MRLSSSWKYDRGCGNGGFRRDETRSQRFGDAYCIRRIDCHGNFVGWVIGGEALTLQRIFGWVFGNSFFCMGIPWSESQVVGTLLGEKIVLTEFIAYLHLGDIWPKEDCPNGQGLSLRMHYVDLQFCQYWDSNGGIGSIAPDRIELFRIGIRAMVAGTLQLV